MVTNVICNKSSLSGLFPYLNWNECGQYYGSYRTDMTGSTDGRTDIRTDKVKPIYHPPVIPPTTMLCRGYNKIVCPGHAKVIIIRQLQSIGPPETYFSEISIKIQNFTKIWPFCSSLNELTHWGREKMDAISQTKFSSAFSWMKIFEFRLKFHWSLFLSVQLTIFQHWFR